MINCRYPRHLKVGLLNAIKAPFFFFVLACFPVVTLFGGPQFLKIENVQPLMEQLFDYHIEFKEWSPLIVKRSFKVYIEQFDLDKTYLLEDEVKLFLELEEAEISDVISSCRVDHFNYYLLLNKVIQDAVMRARKFRREIKKEVGHKEVAIFYDRYAETEEELKSRMRSRFFSFLSSEKETEEFNERREKMTALFERHLCRFEDPYLILDKKGKLKKDQKSEHLFALHLLKAMAKSLDAHTAFYSSEEVFEMRASLEKEFEGIGVVLKEGIEGVTIVKLVKGAPAERCGKISQGDLITSIDGKSVEDISYEKVLEYLKGNQSQKVILGIRKSPADENQRDFQVELVREKIMMQEERLTYSVEPFGNGMIGKLNLPSFYESSDGSSCEQDIREAIKALKKQGKLLGLVLDLRNNSGGFLSQAVKVAGLFITSGVIVISKYADGEVQYLRDIGGRAYYDGPILILTSKMSASAAEIVAQALQDYGVALIVGDPRTYGKGTIQYQTLTDVQAQAFFKVTVGKYYTVSGKSTQIEGVKADIVVPTQYAPYNIGERFLEYPLKRDEMPPAYLDSLIDIDSKNKNWFQKNYLPNLQKRDSKWNKVLPALNRNSSYRLSKDKDFSLFLDLMQPPSERKETLFSEENGINFGVEDLQMTEAVNILKDAILIQH